MDRQVTYDNILNHVSFVDFSEKDFDFFMFLCSFFKDKGTEQQTIKYDDIMDCISWDKSQRIDVFHDEVKRLSNKLRALGGIIDINQDEFVCFNLFTTFHGNKQKRILTVSVNPEFAYVLNDIVGNFTRFELNEYVSLKGRYTKQLYQHLKQFKATGLWVVSLDKFRHEMSIPASMPTMNIKSKILNPSIKTLQELPAFKALKVDVIKTRDRKRSVQGYQFSWKKEESKASKKRFCEKNNAGFKQNDYNFDELEQILTRN